MRLRLWFFADQARHVSASSSGVLAVLLVAWLAFPFPQSLADAPQAASSHQHPPQSEARPIEKILYSEFNHHMSGAGLLVIGLMAMGMELGLARRPHREAVQWLWPAGWILLGSFLFIRSDPDNWPWGSIGLIETLSDLETLQHKVFSVVVVAIGVIEGRQISGWPNGKSWGLVFPLLGIGSGVLLGLHSFVHAHLPQVFWQHVSFALVGILIGVSKLLRDRGVLGTGYRPLLWPMLLIVFAVQLILYTER